MDLTVTEFDAHAMKGYFPHLFNTAANEDYIRPLPDHQYYGTSTMSPAARKKFFKWYESQPDLTFNLKKE